MSYSDLFSSATVPAEGHPLRSLGGERCAVGALVLATTDLDTAGDFSQMCAIPIGEKPKLILLDATADMDTGGTAADFDIVYRTTDANGTNTDVILLNAGTRFTAAITTPTIVFIPPSTVAAIPTSANGFGVIGWKVNVVATTPVSSTVNFAVFW